MNARSLPSAGAIDLAAKSAGIIPGSPAHEPEGPGAVGLLLAPPDEATPEPKRDRLPQTPAAAAATTIPAQVSGCRERWKRVFSMNGGNGLWVTRASLRSFGFPLGKSTRPAGRCNSKHIICTATNTMVRAAYGLYNQFNRIKEDVAVGVKAARSAHVNCVPYFF